MSVRPISSETRRRQQVASDPQLSAWVSAHAGSGKTHVLSQRVVRLLLARTPPSHILCLTYTKAAAANMSARIFDILARWAMLDDEALSREIEATGAATPTAQQLDLARRLFARAVETPGGLKIQTIHAFCERLLHLFPFESNTPAGFRVVDDMERGELVEMARRRALDHAMRDAGALHAALTHVARETSGAGFDALCAELLAHRDLLGSIAFDLDYPARLQTSLGLAPAETLQDVEARMINGGESPAQWLELAGLLRGGSASDVGLAEKLEAARAGCPDCLDAYLDVFFTRKGTPRGVGDRKIITAGLARKAPQLLARMEAERDRLAALIDKRKAAAAAERSLALTRIGAAILDDYARAKRSRGLLDYDDLIAGARRLLQRSDAAWVLYKLDSQIDHILLDEAQDTSAPQWEILSAIAQEFCVGASARRFMRSFFAVGDEKQSIFSFQGAAPEKFDAMRRDFKRRFEASGCGFAWVRLHQSFRSAPGLLVAVDAVFAHGDNRYGLSSDPQEPPPTHEAWKGDVAALVEIWEPLAPGATVSPSDWRLPLDFVAANDPVEELARRIARKIAALLAPQSGECVEERGALRPVEPGDILILVRKRGPLFEALIRALKSAGVPVAGADRLELGKHIVADDLVALGRAALLPDDDLTLAGVLKSPIFDFTDDDLMTIAPGRSGALFAALAGSPDARHRAAAAWLTMLRQEAASRAPFDFYSAVLGPGEGRKRLVARLGPEANDAIDEFLQLALGFEREQAPSLTGFLAMVAALDLSIKRDMEAAGGAVRVMTAHAAKGLEAKIVFLPDTCGAPAGKHDPKLFRLGEGEEAVLVWSPTIGADPPALTMARATARDAERKEHQRLLYVALTRAEERLYVAGCHGASGRAPGCWYDMIRTALEPSCESAADPLGGAQSLLRINSGVVPHVALTRAAAPAPLVETPLFARMPAPAEYAPAPPLRPSSALAGADVSVADLAAPTRQASLALLTGRVMHALLQHLPDCAAERRTEAAQRFLALRAAALNAAERAALVEAAVRLVGDSRFASLFGPQSAPEVDVVGALGGVVVVSGRIDRLAETSDEVLIADFKTGAPQATLGPQHLRQLALYRAALAPLYPGKRIRCLLLWTRTARVDEASEPELDAALAAVMAEAGR